MSVLRKFSTRSRDLWKERMRESNVVQVLKQRIGSEAKLNDIYYLVYE